MSAARSAARATLTMADRCARTNPLGSSESASARSESRTRIVRLPVWIARAVVFGFDPDDVVVRDHEGAAAVADDQLPALLAAIADSRSEPSAIDANECSRRRTRVRSSTTANRSSENGFSR